LLIFADALARSWKQVTKFKSERAILPSAPKLAAVPQADATPAGLPDELSFDQADIVRDERGVRFAKEADD
jgi:cyanophycin synthetase